MNSFDLFRLSQSETPLLNQLKELANLSEAAFYAPGHKKGQGISPLLANLLGNDVFKADLPELPELDNLFIPSGVIQKAQELAAEAFGAKKTWFLVNGSTCGVIASILATCREGDKIILPRNSHLSVISGLILSGAIPIFVEPEYNIERDLLYSVTPESVEKALQQHPDAKAVMVVYPTYHGICCDLEKIAKITHDYNIPLIVDEAHGAHFTFHPSLPPSALSLGADLSIQSTHKVLGAMTQASMLHLNSDRIELERINQALQLVQSSSPSYLLLASLDAARQQMALFGYDLLNQTLELADTARQQLSQIPHLSVLDFSRQMTGFHYLDRTRLTVFVDQLGRNGYDVDEDLRQLGVTAELPMMRHLSFIISISNILADIEKLVTAFQSLLPVSSTLPSIPFPPASPLAISPRQAFFSPTDFVTIEKSVGLVSAELVCPYPPGIPVLMPGEIITSNAIDYLLQVSKMGASITKCSDPNLAVLKVCCA
ncbi:aminotransferase class I/II-fold pyridoxal phosphate-dependent enzyme [Chroococcus sp. FPU101]|uniref:aminotransferase class I/II-fold pyridoxal phosphate-dependent enzyme n=1 Tax=Chroococcus sp. FPU101 TaxID=1974212 RepID=UPI001A8F7932|nr:aminotransferase class I/II-fold pyridoxal phosphate-dependent enzyme [Chroococcus sp. FPU101]GFE71484.1 Orn/Lys/Arg decarboxylase major region [Chroococcus sp. FPU101]